MKRRIAIWSRWVNLLAFFAVLGLVSAPLGLAASCSCAAMIPARVASHASGNCDDCADENENLNHASLAHHHAQCSHEIRASVQPQCHCSADESRAFDVPKSVALSPQIDALAALPPLFSLPVPALITTRGFAPLGHSPPRTCLALCLSPRAPPAL